MIRLFLPALPEHPKTIRLDRAQSRYVVKVLRSRKGDRLTLFDGSGRELLCSILDGGDHVVLAVESQKVSDIKPLKNIALAQGLIKGQKMDLVVQKAAELGIRTFIPVVTERSQVRTTAKVPRWKKIAAEASEQCRRADVMDIREVDTLDNFLSFISRTYPKALKIVFYEEGGKSLKSFEEEIRTSEDIVLFTGPEGGFSREEINLLAGAGFEAVYLGRMILRAETASIVAAGIIQYMGGHFS